MATEDNGFSTIYIATQNEKTDLHWLCNCVPHVLEYNGIVKSKKPV